jgi:hypothetical protein
MTISGFGNEVRTLQKAAGLSHKGSASRSGKNSGGVSDVWGDTPSDTFVPSDDWLTIVDQRLALASTMTGNESFATRYAVQTLDKSLAIKEARAKIQSECAINLEDALIKARKKNTERRKQQIDAGVIFSPF